MVGVQDKRSQCQILPTLAQSPHHCQSLPVARVVTDLRARELARHIPNWHKSTARILKQHRTHAQPRGIRFHHKVTTQVRNDKTRSIHQSLPDAVKFLLRCLVPLERPLDFLLRLEHVSDRDNAPAEVWHKLTHVVGKTHEPPDLLKRPRHWIVPQPLDLVLADLDSVMRDMHTQKIHGLHPPLTLRRIEVDLVVTQSLKHHAKQCCMLSHVVAGVRQIVDVTHDIRYPRNDILHEQLITGRCTLQPQTRHIEKERTLAFRSKTRESCLLPVFHCQCCLIKATEVV